MRIEYDIEKSFLSKLVETQDLETIKNKQIKPMFFIGENKTMFQYIQDYKLNFGEFPTLRVIKSRFPLFRFDTYEKDGLKIIGTDEPMLFWCEEVRKKMKHNTIAQTMAKALDNMEDMNTEEAYDKIKSLVLEVEDNIIESSMTNITENSEDRKARYLKNKETKGMLGIPMGIDMLDFYLKGMQNEQLITIMSKTGVGKTFLLTMIATNAMLNNYRGIFYTTEMSPAMIRDRNEVLLYKQTVGDISYSRFKSGSLTAKEQENYFDFLDNILPKLEPMYLDVAAGVSGIVSDIELLQPDFVVIDSAYLMPDDRGAKDDWLRVAHITRDLHNVAGSKHIPIIISVQADSNSNVKTGPELGNAKYAKAIEEDSDVVMSMFQSAEMRGDKQMLIKILKNREGGINNITMNWDFDTMEFSAIHQDDKGGDEEDRENVKQEGVVKLQT